MMEEYTFKLQMRNKLENFQENNKFSLEYRITVDSNTVLKNFEISIREKYASDSIKATGEVTSSTEPFLMHVFRGYFEFSDIGELECAFYELINGVPETSKNNYTSKWLEFRKQFFDWYNHQLKPIIDKDIELFYRCSKLNNTEDK